MIEISLCMIVKNEKEVLERCLSSVMDCFDEIIIVDTGSKDSTKEIARKFTDKIFDFDWCDDFSKARNFAFSKSTKPYVMWLDADDVLKDESKQKLMDLKKTLEPDVAQVYMKYNIDFDEFENPTFSYYRERLFKKENNPIWIEPIHEYVFCPGKTLLSEIEINHKKTKKTNPKRNLKIFNKLKKDKKTLSPRLQYYYARELMYNNLTKKAIHEFEKFLKQGKGWVQNNIEASFELANCYEQLNQTENGIFTLLKSFSYDLPSGEILCKLGQIYQKKNDYEKAVFWFELALEKSKKSQYGFVQNDYYGFFPAINLCVLHYMLGNKNKAKLYNDIAGSFKPNDKSFLHNKELFEKENIN